MQSVLGNHGGKDKETIFGLRKAALRPVFFFSSAQASSGILVFVLGIVLTALGAGSGKFPFNTGYGIWTGLTVCVGGISGVFLSRCDVAYELPTPIRIRTLGGLYYGFCISGLSMFGISLGYSISAVITASNSNSNDTSSYIPHADPLQNIGIIIILLSVVMGITSIYGFVFFIRNRKLLGFYSRTEQALLQHIAALENNLPGQNQQGYGASVTVNQYGEVDKNGLRQENYNQWSDNPPAYSKS